MSCQTLSKGDSCGVHGVCANETLGLCVCESGWSQNLEFNFGIEEDQFQSSLCYFNETLIRVLYSIIVVFCIGHTAVLLWRVRSKRQLYKRAVYIVVAFCVVSLSLIRVVNPASGYGDNYAYSAFLTIALALILYVGYDYLVTYLDYVESKFAYMQSFRGTVSRKIFTGVTAIGLLYLTIVTGLVLFSDLSNKTKGGLMRGMIGYQVFFYLYQTIFLFASLSDMIKDMETFLRLKQKAVLSMPSDPDKDYQRRVEKNLPKVKKTRIRFLVLGVILLSLLLVPTLLPDRILYFTYVVPMLLILHYVYSFVHVVSKTIKRGRASSRRDLSSTRDKNVGVSYHGAVDISLTQPQSFEL